MQLTAVDVLVCLSVCLLIYSFFFRYFVSSCVSSFVLCVRSVFFCSFVRSLFLLCVLSSVCVFVPLVRSFAHPFVRPSVRSFVYLLTRLLPPDDSRAPARPEGQLTQVIRGRRSCGDREHLGRPGPRSRLESPPVRSVLLQRDRAREEEVRRPWLEHSLRVHRLGLGGQ